MCKRKSEGGRCNGWYAKEIEKMAVKIYDEAGTLTVKQFDKYYNRYHRLVAEVKEKPVIEINSDMTVQDLKREKKRINKTLELYRFYDEKKYEETLSNIGKVVRKHIDLDYPRKLSYFEQLEARANTETEAIANFNKNSEKLKKYLNEDLGIKTGNPNKDYLGKTTSRGKDIYNKVTDLVPSSFFDDKLGVKLNISETTSRRRGAYQVETIKQGKPAVDCERRKDFLQSFMNQNGLTNNSSDEEILEKFQEQELDNTTHARVRGHEFGYPGGQVKKVVRENGEVVGVEFNVYTYKIGSRKPNALKGDISKEFEWEVVDDFNSINVDKKVYRRMVMDTNNAETVVHSRDIKVNKYSNTNTMTHEVIHSVEDISPKLCQAESAILESRKQQGLVTKTYQADGGTFHEGAFKENYMSKSYRNGHHEIFSMTVPEILTQQTSTEEYDVQDAFLGLIVIAD